MSSSYHDTESFNTNRKALSWIFFQFTDTRSWCKEPDKGAVVEILLMDALHYYWTTLSKQNSQVGVLRLNHVHDGVYQIQYTNNDVKIEKDDNDNRNNNDSSLFYSLTFNTQIISISVYSFALYNNITTYQIISYHITPSHIVSFIKFNPIT